MVDHAVVGAADVVGVGRVVVGRPRAATRSSTGRRSSLPVTIFADGIHLEEAVVAADVDLPEHPGPRVVRPVGLPVAAGVVDVDRLAGVGVPSGRNCVLEAVAREAEVGIVGVGDPEPVDARVVDETRARTRGPSGRSETTLPAAASVGMLAGAPAGAAGRRAPIVEVLEADTRCARRICTGSADGRRPADGTTGGTSISWMGTAGRPPCRCWRA